MDDKLCQECNYYDDTLTFPDTGYCTVYKDYVRRDNNACFDFSEED